MTTLSSHHIFEILFLVGGRVGPISATEISRSLGIPLTTVHRALNTLEQMRFIDHFQGSKSYVLGSSSRALVHSFLRHFPLRDLAIPHMHRLVVLSGDTVSLFCPVGWYMVRTASIKGTNEVIHTGPLGETRSLAEHPAGVAMLAFSPADAQAEFMRAGSDNDTSGLRRQMEAARHDGYIIEDHGSCKGHCVIPILDENGYAVGVIAIEAADRRPAQTITSAQADAYVAQLGNLGERVRSSAGLYRPPFAHIAPSTIVLHHEPAAVVRVSA